MKIFGLGKGYLLGLLFFVIPVGGLLIYPKFQSAPNYSVMVTVEKGRVVVGDCLENGSFEDYLADLNAANKKKNIICEFAGDLTTMSKAIQCRVMNGPTMANLYWAETMDECIRVKKSVTGEK